MSRNSRLWVLIAISTESTSGANYLIIRWFSAPKKIIHARVMTPEVNQQLVRRACRQKFKVINQSCFWELSQQQRYDARCGWYQSELLHRDAQKKLLPF